MDNAFELIFFKQTLKFQFIIDISKLNAVAGGDIASRSLPNANNLVLISRTKVRKGIIPYYASATGN